VSSAALQQDLVLGRYRPLKPLGAGGMGHVWLARDERSGLEVSLKIIAREGKAGARAEREARAAASLRHPRCQRILSLARDPGHVYIAYEYIPGRTLREALRTGELDDVGAVEVAAQIADALAHAHGRGIVHRDVKPSNVLLAESATIDVRLVDFGLAQMAEFDTLTALGDIPGTLAYISPERLHGRQATEAADVWAVGVVLWEALAGKHPFWCGDMVETSHRIQSGAPRLETLRPDLPRSLLEVVDRALVVSPQRRPRAAELAAQLRSAPRRRRSSGSGALTRQRPAAAPALARALPAVLSATASAWVSARLPFYPSGAPLLLGGLGAVLGFASPRAGLALALGTAVLPLANASLGLAILYAGVALAWLAFTWRDARNGLLVAVGPLLAPLSALALVPLVVQLARGRARRAVYTAGAVLLAAVSAGLAGAPLPFDGRPAPLGLGITGSRRPTAVAGALWRQLESHPALIAEAVILGAAAALLPLVRRRGPWAAAGFGAALLAATALAAPVTAFAPLALAAWATAGLLVAEGRFRTAGSGQ